ncbi:MAG TPA: DNA methyltransferase [Candidatus Saccharimonadia bacterium]
MSSLNYLAILGRQPELGLVELESVLGEVELQPFGRGAVLLDQPVEVDRFGSLVRVAEVLYRGPAVDARELPIDVAVLPMREGKTPFALSMYGLQATRRYVETVGLALKKRLKERGPVRLVEPREGLVVSAAGLKHNQVLEKGFELLVVVAGQEMVVARTLGVQDVDAYAARDHGRPARSAKVGMLPPKLAQFLVNTTHAPVVVDPFCGTGVVLQEARLLGRQAVGSDLSPEMVAATRTNMAWLDEQRAGLPEVLAVETADARAIRLPENSALVSEGYLGPNLSVSPTSDRLKAMRAELKALYSDCLRNWAAQLLPGAEVSLCMPAWRVKGHWEYLEMVDELPHLGYTLKSFAQATTPLLYARSDQVVGRQLLLLRKN